MKKIYTVLFIILFIGGIVLGLFGRAYCTRDNQNYAELQPESFIPDVIETVLQDEKLKQIYVCYNDANYVNVYSESGEFLWAVATPYIRYSYFELQEDKLIIYGDDAYIYNSANGEFLGIEKVENLDLEYNWEDEQTDEFIDGEIYFDSYQVYKADPNGTLYTIVSRPWWHWIFNFGVCWCISFVGALGIGITIFVEKKRSYDGVKKKVKFKNRKAKIIINYFRVTSIVQLVYAGLDVVFGFFGGILCIGIIPVAIHFIASNWILRNMLDYISISQDERTVADYWGTLEIVTLIIAVASVLIAAGIAG